MSQTLLSNQEKRKYARLDIALSVSYVVNHADGQLSDLANALSCDISAGGIRLMTPTPLNTGDIIDLEISILDSEEDPIRAKGEVVWQTKISSTSYETGTIIKSMARKDKSRFMSFVFDQMSRLVGTTNEDMH